MTITKNEATKLWSDLRTNLLATEDSIRKIIKTKAWEPLGYASFIEAWEDQLSQYELTKGMLGSVIYAMLSEGTEEERIANAVKGVSGEQVKFFNMASRLGISEDLAHIHVEGMIAVPAHMRRPQCPQDHVRVFLGRDVISDWKKKLNETDDERSLNTIAQQILLKEIMK